MLSLLHPAPIDTISSSPLRSPRKFSPRRPEYSFFFIESGLEVIQQDNTRELLSRSTLSSIKLCRRLHRNTRAPNASHHFGHIPQPPIFLPTTNTLPQSKPPSPQKTRRMLLSDSPAKTTKISINIAFLSPFHVKHRLKSHISTPLNPSALPHDRRHQTTRHIGQCKHASIFLPRSILRRFTYSAPLSL